MGTNSKVHMRAQIFLITPPDIGIEFSSTLKDALADNDVAALLIQRGDRDDADYIEIAQALIPIAQSANCAALLDNMPEAVRKLGADGVHMTGAPETIIQAVKSLKPNAIVGAGGIHTKHDAMTKGELGIDYVFFGHLAAAKSDDEFTSEQLANWWAETFEIPAVVFNLENADMDASCEFRAVREQVWTSENPNAAIAAIGVE
ncbi:thiamine phosphate synthase [Maritalea sp.]|uniref:thiamine phosphate synthase n=1 Tax=Maritalea sp. TaxID=2003361 RepID=UPI003EF93DFB